MCDELFHTFCVFLKSHKDKRSFQFCSVWNVRRLSQQNGRHLNSPVSTGCKNWASLGIIFHIFPTIYDDPVC